MIRTQGEILRDPSGRLILQASCRAACQGCGVRKVCGGSQRSLSMTLSSDQQQGIRDGQSLQMDIAEEELLRLTLLAYTLPCLLLILFALLASPWGDLAALLGSLLGLGLGVGLSTWRARRRPPEIQLIATQPETHHDSTD
jgi:positive regulator of sigma E activity